MTETNITDLVTSKANELLVRPSQEDAWAACASIWARLFTLAAPAWRRWPGFLSVVQEAMQAALQVSVSAQFAIGGAKLPLHGMLISRLEAFDIEDDGSAEWQFVIDLIAMLSIALDSRDPAECLRVTLHTYLEGMFNILSNKLAIADGRSISRVEARNRLAHDREWTRTVSFVTSL